MKQFIKLKLFNLLAWLLNRLGGSKFDGVFIEKENITVGYAQYVPKDGNWHSVNVYVSFWLKNGPEENYGDVMLAVDGGIKFKDVQ